MTSQILSPIVNLMKVSQTMESESPDTLSEAREAIESWVESGVTPEDVRKRKELITSASKRLHKEVLTQSTMTVTLTESEHGKMVDGDNAQPSVFSPVSPEMYEPDKEDNFFINDYSARLPKWVLRALMAKDDAPTKFLQRITVEDLRATTEVLRKIVQSQTFQDDARLIERLTQEMDGMAHDQTFDAHLWTWVARVLLSEVATRFVMNGILQLREHEQGASKKPKYVNGIRYRADLLHWSAVPEKDPKSFCFRFAVIGNPGWVRVGRAGSSPGHGRHGPRLWQRIPRHHLMHCMVETVLRVATNDAETPMHMSTRAYLASEIAVQATMSVVPTSKTSLADESEDVGMYVNPLLTFLPSQCTKALRSFMCTRDITSAFQGLPLARDKVDRATQRAFAVRLPDVYSFRMVLGRGVDSTTYDETFRIAPEPLFSGSSRSQRSAVSVVLQRQVEESYRQLVRNLEAYGGLMNRIDAREPMAIGAVPIRTSSPAWEQGLFDCFFGPIVEYCRLVFGRTGLAAFVRKGADGQSVDGAGRWAFEPKAPFGAMSSEDAYNRVHLDAVEGARSFFEAEPWDAEDDSDPEENGDNNGPDHACSEPAAKRRRLEGARFSRQIHLGAAQARIRWDRSGRRGGPPLPLNQVPVKTRYGDVMVQGDWCARVEA